VTIFDGRAIAEASAGLVGVDPRGLLLSFYPEAIVAPLDVVAAGAAPLVAEVRHGVWMAVCDCGAEVGADVAAEPAPGCIVWCDWALGWCVRCGNAHARGAWRQVLVPDEAQRRAIEAVLELRTDVASRNWAPPETVEDLLAENAAHGITGGPA